MLARVSEKLVSPGLPGLQVATCLIEKLRTGWMAYDRNYVESPIRDVLWLK